MGLFSTKNLKKKSAPPKSLGPDATTQLHLLIAEIKDNVLVLKDGSVRSILKVHSVNYDLLSEQEQNLVIYAYQEFLNTLEFPIQILIRSSKLDIEHYLENMDKLATAQTNEVLKAQTYEYIDFIATLVEMADIMQKDFYVIVPHAPVRSTKVNAAQGFFRALNPSDSPANARLRGVEFASLHKTLKQRTTTVRDGLSRCGLKTEELTTKEIIELFYNAYNPQTSQNQRLSDLAGLDIPVPVTASPTDNE